MAVVSRPARQKSWQIAGEIVSLLDALNVHGEQLGVRLRTLARARGITSDEDAARLIGVSYRQYQRWLSGESDPRSTSLKQIAQAFEIPLVELLGEPDPTQLDRIEAKLERLLARIDPADQPLSAGEEADRVLDEMRRELAPGAGGDRPGAGS